MLVGGCGGELIGPIAEQPRAAYSAQALPAPQRKHPSGRVRMQPLNGRSQQER